MGDVDNSPWEQPGGMRRDGGPERRHMTIPGEKSPASRSALHRAVFGTCLVGSILMLILYLAAVVQFFSGDGD